MKTSPHSATRCQRRPASLLVSPLAIAISLAASAAQAQTAMTQQSEHPVSLPTLEVNAKRAPSAVERTTLEQSTVATVDAEKLASTLSYSIADATRYEPGVLVTNKGRFGLAGFNVRGLDENRVSIGLDGLEMAESYGPTSTYLKSSRVSVDVESLAGINVIKGGDAVAGSGLSGVVDMRLKAPEDFLAPSGDDSYASFKAGYRSDRKGFFESTTLAARRGEYESMLVLTNRHGQATRNHESNGSDDRTSGTSRTTPDPGDIDNYDLLLKLQRVMDNGRIGMVAQKYRASSQLHTFSSETSSYRDYFTDDSLTRTRLGIYQDAMLDTAMFDDVRWRLDWQRTSTIDDSSFTYATAASAYDRKVDREYTQNSWQLKADFAKALELGVPQQLAYGVVIKRDAYNNRNSDFNLDAGSVEATRFSPPGTATRIGLYLQDRLSFADDRGSLTPALRFDRYSYDLDNDGLTSQSYDDAEDRALTGQIGGTWRFTPNLQLFGKTGFGFRAPSYDELYYDYAVAGRPYRIVANPDLQPEYSRFVELGLRFDGRLGSAEVTSFYTHYRNFIESNASVSIDPANYPFGEFTTRNLDRALIRGFEAKGVLDLAQAFGWAQGLSLRGALAYIEGKNLEDGGAIQSVPPVQGVVSLGYDAPSQRWGSELAATFVNHVSQADAGASPYAPGAYQLYDLTGYLRVGEHLTLRGGVFNLADKQYWVWDDVRGLATNAGIDRYTQPGRNFGASVEYVF
ncbi:TonB-dependent hemoglobin/transferrin/lactoferrin family receptor [Halotalea alkalilenta]|uniref:TonB-dependent hemoglobin/transferrin/lactoferrin family receptor n=1 Tax=Halotalea alkalilenta TaxID=376489 RepID=UPI00047FB13B|nr:TonB-dependent hemoglobin/transferrin/lactoferrin family receptor [Halotalea alkalilenta]